MNNPKALKVVITVLVVAFLTSLVFLAAALWQDFWWKKAVSGLACYEGAERAKHDFHDSKIRFFVIAGDHEDEIYSGTNDGPFQIWFPQYFRKPYSLRYSAEQMVWAYNEEMRIDQNFAAKSVAPTNRQSNNH